MKIAEDLYDMFPMYGEDELFRDVDRRIIPEDSMLEGVPGDFIMRTRYFSVGASALSVIRAVHRARERSTWQVHRVLDYACGYGRVHRWLRAAFPHAVVQGVDADLASVQGARILGYDAQILDLALTQNLGKFDLIWVGSLFTHLSYNESQRTLKYLREHLAPQGVLIATFHGMNVLNRIRSGTEYGLGSDGLQKLLESYRSTGWGYADYPAQSGYGISISRADKVSRLLEDCAMEMFFFQAGGWDRHQDVYGCAGL